MKDNILIINPRDNVAVALRNLRLGEQTAAGGMESFPATEDIPASHKIALRDIAAGEEIIKYGETIGVSTADIKKGAWAHTHNIESERWQK